MTPPSVKAKGDMAEGAFTIYGVVCVILFLKGFFLGAAAMALLFELWITFRD